MPFTAWKHEQTQRLTIVFIKLSGGFVIALINNSFIGSK